MSEPDAIVLFDGVCTLCDGLVRFVASQDPDARVGFLPLQSARAAQLLDAAASATPGDGSFVLIAFGRRYERSDAALHAALFLRRPWPLAFAAILIPQSLRDALYRYVARNRYRWFGKKERCALPPPGLRERFLDERATLAEPA